MTFDQNRGSEWSLEQHPPPAGVTIVPAEDFVLPTCASSKPFAAHYSDRLLVSWVRSSLQ